MDKRHSFFLLDSEIARIEALIDSYWSAFNTFQIVIREAKVKPDHVSSLTPKDGAMAHFVALDKIRINCDTALAYLEQLVSRIPSKEKDELNSLKGQLAPLEVFDAKLFAHLNSAIEEYEEAHYLASALLAGKAIVYVLEQLPGETDEDKASALVKSSLLDEKIKPNFLKGARRARVHFTHDISAIPLPQDALGLVSDACDLSLKLMKAKTK